MKRFIGQDEAEELALSLSREIEMLHPGMGIVHLWGVPRGGYIPAYLLALVNKRFKVVSDISEADIIIDDLIDSGKTLNHYSELYPNKPFFVLLIKEKDDDWITFFWEQSAAQTGAEDIPIRLLQFIGEDATRGGLIDTPTRFLKAWTEKTSGYGQDPAAVLKVFEDGAADYDELVVIKDIEIESVCEHHLERIWGVAHIGYIPNGKILGLSKMHRLVEIFGRRLQVQERLTTQIAKELQAALDPVGLGVVIEARHACMEARGIRRRGQTTITSSMHGALRSNPEARSEFLKLATTKKEL